MLQGFTILFWMAAGSIFALAASVVLLLLAWALTLGKGPRKGLLVWSLAAPWLVLGFYGVTALAVSIVNVTMLGRDAGLGQNYRCPLPGGYVLEAVDRLDHATLEGPAGRVTGVQELHLVDEDLVLGASDSGKGGVFDANRVDEYFQMRKGEGVRRFATEAELAVSGIRLALEPVADVYAKHRPSGADRAGTFVVSAAGLTALFLWQRGVRRVRHRSNA